MLGDDDRCRQVRRERGEKRIKHRRSSGRRANQHHYICFFLADRGGSCHRRERDKVPDLLDEFPLDAPDVRNIPRFEHEVIRPESKCLVGHIGLPRRQCAQDDHLRSRSLLPERFKHLKTAHPGHLDVEGDDVGLQFRYLPEGVDAVDRCPDDFYIRAVFEQIPEDCPDKE